MSYDKELYDRVQGMDLGDLVHFMVNEFDDRSRGEPFLQSTGYFWACERLNEIGRDLGHSAPNLGVISGDDQATVTRQTPKENG